MEKQRGRKQARFFFLTNCKVGPEKQLTVVPMAHEASHVTHVCGTITTYFSQQSITNILISNIIFIFCQERSKDSMQQTEKRTYLSI